MSDRRLSVRLSEQLQKELAVFARQSGLKESQIVRDALEEFCRKRGTRSSAFDLARDIGLIGCADDLPRDLSTNPKHFEGFGRD